jgi:hypothetical protein
MAVVTCSATEEDWGRPSAEEPETYWKDQWQARIKQLMIEKKKFMQKFLQ